MTIYALSSGPGLSGVAVIRLSGSETDKVFSHKKIFTNPRVATLSNLLIVNLKSLLTKV